MPQLLVLHDKFLEFEFEVNKFFSEYKDEFARLRTITQTLLLLNILRNHVRSTVYIGLVSVVPLEPRTLSGALFYIARVGLS